MDNNTDGFITNLSKILDKLLNKLLLSYRDKRGLISVKQFDFNGNT